MRVVDSRMETPETILSDVYAMTLQGSSRHESEQTIGNG
jgi:hypothetical protein